MSRGGRNNNQSDHRHLCCYLGAKFLMFLGNEIMLKNTMKLLKTMAIFIADIKIVNNNILFVQ